MATDDLQAAVLSQDRVEALTNRSLHLILLPTEKCNFRCVYCYEDFVSGSMHEHVVEGVKGLIKARAPELDRMQISWFGGEPLLAYPIMLNVQTYAHEVRRRLGLVLDASVTTNGSMLSARRHEHLSSLGVNLFQISLDGARALHDTTRVLASGRGTFDSIWSNLLSIRDNSRGAATCMLRLHLTALNFASLASLISKISEAFGRDCRFRVYFRTVDDYGGDGGTRAMELNVLDKTGQIGELKKLLPANMHADEAVVDTNICYAARANSWLIRANGRVGKCTVALTDDRNTIGTISATGELLLDQGKWQDWVAPLLANDADGMACPWHTLPRVTEVASTNPFRVLN